MLTGVKLEKICSATGRVEVTRQFQATPAHALDPIFEKITTLLTLGEVSTLSHILVFQGPR